MSQGHVLKEDCGDPTPSFSSFNISDIVLQCQEAYSTWELFHTHNGVETHKAK